MAQVISCTVDLKDKGGDMAVLWMFAHPVHHLKVEASPIYLPISIFGPPNKVCSWIEEAQSYFMDASHSIWRLDINICQQHKLLLATFHNTSTTFSSYSFSLFLSFFLILDWMGLNQRTRSSKGVFNFVETWQNLVIMSQ